MTEGARRPLRLAVAQPDNRPHDIAANARIHAELVREAGARVVVFPELSLTGYHMDAPTVRADDAALEPLIEACGETGTVALAGGPAEGAGGQRTIAVWAVDGDGARAAYHKMWLGAAEADHFTPGPAPAVLTVNSWRLGLAVCKDTGVPEHTAATTALGIDVYVAGVLETAADTHVQPARAARIVEAHEVWVAVAAFAGSTGEGYDIASGGSAIWNPAGECVSVAGRAAGEWAAATID